MHDDLPMGIRVRTIKPERESTDWQPGAARVRRWNVEGTVIGRSDSHGLIFEIDHEDGSKAWYERRELQRLDKSDKSPTVWDRLRKGEL